MIAKKYKILFCTIVATVCLSSCGNASKEDKQLAVFSSSIEEFTQNIKDADIKINNLDTTDIQSPKELLLILDDLNSEFEKLAVLEVPDQYKNTKGLISDASEYMSQAVSYYHTAFEGEEFDKGYADAAYQNYERAMLRIECIGYLLAGKKIPTNDNIKVYEENNDSELLNKWLSDDEHATNPTTETNIDF